MDLEKKAIKNKTNLIILLLLVTELLTAENWIHFCGTPYIYIYIYIYILQIYDMKNK